MKSLEADAVQAQAVIAKAQEMSRDSSTGLHTVDIAFAGESCVRCRFSSCFWIWFDVIRCRVLYYSGCFSILFWVYSTGIALISTLFSSSLHAVFVLCMSEWVNSPAVTGSQITQPFLFLPLPTDDEQISHPNHNGDTRVSTGPFSPSMFRPCLPKYLVTVVEMNGINTCTSNYSVQLYKHLYITLLSTPS